MRARGAVAPVATGQQHVVALALEADQARGVTVLALRHAEGHLLGPAARQGRRVRRACARPNEISSLIRRWWAVRRGGKGLAARAPGLQTGVSCKAAQRTSTLPHPTPPFLRCITHERHDGKTCAENQHAHAVPHALCSPPRDDSSASVAPSAPPATRTVQGVAAHGAAAAAN